jgi:hypothetical protein
MSLARKLQKVFASSASNDVRAFGKLAAGGTISYSQDPDVIQSLSAFLNGWASATVGNHSPSLQDMDSLFFLLTYQIAYLMQRGIAQYHAGQTYAAYDVCVDPDGTGIYVSQQADNTGNALNNPTWWATLASTLNTYTQAGAISSMGAYRPTEAGNLSGTVDPNFADVYAKINQILAAMRTFPVIHT